jgi:hypothetical protein
MSDQDKPWSEFHKSADGHYATDDITHAIGGEADSVLVDDRVTRRGIILLGNCGHCGRQWKSVSPWPEVMMIFVQAGTLPGEQPLPGVQMTKNGVVLAMGCRCGKATPLVLGWDEVQKYGDAGVRNGFLPPTIYRTASERAMKRASLIAQQQGR